MGFHEEIGEGEKQNKTAIKSNQTNKHPDRISRHKTTISKALAIISDVTS